ncbi:hypothetical protein [Pseudomonas sp. UM16]|uniref:hypothetical protein n=1 Tax=Pseudomonas sp. UM16 TaxID=3158962 RepID=UPI00398F9904
MNKLFTALLVTSITLAASAAMAKGGNPKNNGNYDINNDDITPLFVWREGRLVKNPEYLSERRSSKENSAVAARESEASKQYE